MMYITWNYSQFMSINIKIFLPKGLIGWLDGLFHHLGALWAFFFFFKIVARSEKCSATSWLEIWIEILFFWTILARAFFCNPIWAPFHFFFLCYRGPGWYAATINHFCIFVSLVYGLHGIRTNKIIFRGSFSLKCFGLCEQRWQLVSVLKEIMN